MEPEVKLVYMYLLVDSDGDVQRLAEEPGQEEAVNVDDGDIVIIRFLAFSDAAKAMSGKPGRIEIMSANKEDPQEDESGYEIKWTELP